MNAFDAYQALASDAPHSLPAPADTRVEPQPPTPIVAAIGLRRVPAAGDVAPTRAIPLAAAGVAVPTEARPAAPAESAAGADGNAPAGEVGGLQQWLMRKPTPAQLWSLGAAVLAVLIALQAAFAYRSELAARSPIVRSAFAAICDHAGCSVTLPQRPDLVRIEASDVHMIDANRPQLVQLTATLRSYASHDLAYPALDLVLTNANEHALARRIFTPDEYLDQTRDPQAGIAGNAEITIALDLDTGNLNAAGFRLDLLPAP